MGIHGFQHLLFQHLCFGHDGVGPFQQRPGRSLVFEGGGVDADVEAGAPDTGYGGQGGYSGIRGRGGIAGLGHLQRQRLLPIHQPKDLTWKAEGHVYKAKATASGWTAELFVPFSAFEDGPPKVYDSWNFNFATTDRSRKPSVSASTSLTGLAHGNLAMYGIIRFSGKGD